ncbi:MAG: energy transducer TonB [Candidatus Binatia bacterium]
MPRAVRMRIAAEWDPQFTRMVGVSALGHTAVLLLVLFVLPLIKPVPLPIVAYTVELTDPSALGGKIPPGRPDQPLGPRPGATMTGDAEARLGEPEVKPEPVAPPPEPAKVQEPPKPAEPEVKLPSPEKPPPPQPQAKKPPEPKPEPPKPQPAKPEPPKPEAARPTDIAAKPAEPKPAGKPTAKPEGAAADGADPYAAAAQKWRTKAATGGGGGLGGSDTSGGPIGSGGYGPGGGGQVVGIEFLAYQQRVVSTVKAAWVNAVTRAGLVAKVRFQIAPNGEVSGVRLEQTSGDPAYDASVQRAVQRANPLPPPPARYVSDFREFVIEFKSEEEGGGQGAG